MDLPKFYRRGLLSLAVAVVGILLTGGVATASHSWGPPYHWARTSNPLTLKVGDNVSAQWDSYLNTAIADWSQSSVVDLTKVAGSTRPKNCRPTAGRVEVCNARYGNNGWLGIAQIWITGGEHITQGIVKMNDYYFDTASYNTPGWRSLVMCQEPGHILGLTHQDENFNNPPINPHTCMDYFVPSTNEIVHPNQHDFDQLASIYSHLDNFSSSFASAPARGANQLSPESAESWGQVIRRDDHGQPSVYENDLGFGRRIITHVIWAE